MKLAQDNAVRNGVADKVRVFEGSISALESTTVGQSFGLILANIRASILEDFIRAGIDQQLKAGGRIVMSGILEDQLDPLLELAKETNLQTERIVSTDDWRTVIFIAK